jgi:hypothetical protein
MAREDYSNPLDPFGDPFKMQREPKGGVPKKRKPPSAVPEIRALYDLQTDILKALSELEKDEYEGPAMRHMRNSYKIINRYLRQYGPGTKEEFSIGSDV